MTVVPYLFSPKRPGDRRSFGFDFSTCPELQRHGITPAQRVSDYSVTCLNPDNILVIEAAVLSGTQNNPAVISAYINGGVSKTTYEILYQITTDLGSVIGRTVLLPVDASV